MNELRSGKIKPRHRRSFGVLLALSCLVSPMAFADSLDKTNLLGRWDYTSYTVLKNGKPSGTVQFKPGAMMFTYRPDGTWAMEANDATHTKLNGTYEVRGRKLIMRKTDGAIYQDFDVQLDKAGRAMIMKDKRSIVTATKVETAP